MTSNSQPYKAFVSSTFIDLKDHRAHVISSLRNAGFFVDPMENWSADSDEPKKFSQDRLAGCDLCVLLVGFRRGFVPDGETRSITQLEYDAAIAQGIDVLVFQLDDNDAKLWSKYDDREKDPTVQEWRGSLGKKHGVQFFTDDPRSIDMTGALGRWLSRKQTVQPGSREVEDFNWPGDESPYPGLRALQETTDIYVSYASEDRERVGPLARALEQEGWSVWWDREIPMGQSFDEVTQNALNAAKVVVVVWTNTSVKSQWVKNEAKEGLRRGVLFPVILHEEIKIPLEFRHLQPAQLMDWQPAQAHSGFAQFVQDITGVLGTPASSSIRRSSQKLLKKRLSAQLKTKSEALGHFVGASQTLPWSTWLSRGLRIVAFPALLVVFLFGNLVVARWGLTTLNTSAEAKSESLVCRTLDGMGPEMIIVSAGSFQMGAAGDKGLPTELPRHSVTIRTVGISTCEVTFDEYDRFAQATGRSLPNDEGWGRGRRPVINVSWDDAKAYAIWLSEGTGKGYRLPTEAEWEYAARSEGKDETWAGTSEEGQLKDYAVYRADRTALVGGKKPNGLGLYDMSGNVREWVEDCWHGDYTGAPADGLVWREANGGVCGMRGVRGGSWYNKSENLRASNRDGDGANHRRYTFGFRLAQELER